MALTPAQQAQLDETTSALYQAFDQAVAQVRSAAHAEEAALKAQLDQDLAAARAAAEAAPAEVVEADLRVALSEQLVHRDPPSGTP